MVKPHAEQCNLNIYIHTPVCAIASHKIAYTIEHRVTWFSAGSKIGDSHENDLVDSAFVAVTEM